MSKASEWAIWISERPKCMVPDGEGGLNRLAEVSDRGALRIYCDLLDAEDSLALARWIIDTFGDAPSTKEGV